MSGEMIKAIEHKEGDWRRGKGWKQVIEDTRQGEREKQFQEWKRQRGSEVKIGEEGEEAVTEEVRELYLRLIFAYQGGVHLLVRVRRAALCYPYDLL